MTTVFSVPDGANALDVLAEQLRQDVAYTNQGREQWIEGMLRQAQHLRDARERFGCDDTAFGAWLTKEDVEIDKNDRSALIAMGAKPEQFRTILAKQTKMLTANTIWDKNKGAFPKIGKVQEQAVPRRGRKALQIKRAKRYQPRPPEHHAAAAKCLDEGKSREQVAIETGLSEHQVQLAREREIGRREALAEYGLDETPELPARADQFEPIDTRPIIERFGRLSDKALTREQVDPDFKGNAIEYATEYGAVQLHTKAEIERNRQQDALQAWLGMMPDCVRSMQAMATALASVDPATLQEWKGKPGKAKKLQDWFNGIRFAYEAVGKFCS